MQYDFKNSEGQIEKVDVERWSWGVVYKPTAEAIATAEKELKERNEKLEKEMTERIEKAKKDPRAVKNLKDYFENELSKPVPIFKEELQQFSFEGNIFHQFKEIRQDDVEMFVMFKPEDISKRFDVVCQGKVQYFHFYRNFVLMAKTKNEERKKIYVFGWKSEGKAVYHYILPDDRMVIADHDINNLTNFNI